MKIAICDDEKKLRKDLRALIETQLDLCGADYTIEEFEDGKKLLDSGQSREIEILFLDIEMPVMGGMETAKALSTLDNAIEACLKMENKEARWISVKARYVENGYFSYEIKNSKCNEIKMRRERFITDKADSLSHGVGISSVKEIVEKYAGTIDISFTDDEFKVVILIGEG